MDVYDFYNKLMAIFQFCVDTDNADIKIAHFDDILTYKDSPLSIVVTDSSGKEFEVIIKEL